MIKKEFKKGIPCKAKGDDGDSMLWAGLLASVGESHGSAIINCQSDDGRLWRSPSRVNVDTENSFSRDMAIGYLLAAARDGQTYQLLPFFTESWIKYLKKTGKLCPDATDNRSRMTPALWWMIAKVAPKETLWFYRLTSFLLLPYLWVAAKTAPKGFQTHLAACSLYFLTILKGDKRTGFWHKLTSRILSKRQPENPFFLWLDGQNDKADKITHELSEIVEAHPGDGSQWFLERADSEDAWKDSCGHDFDFMFGLLG